MSVTITTPASTIRLTPLRVTDLLQGVMVIVMMMMMIMIMVMVIMVVVQLVLMFELLPGKLISHNMLMTTMP